jgi:syntaxin 1B/2/3
MSENILKEETLLLEEKDFDFDFDIISERNEEIKKIEQDVQMIHEIMNDLALMIYEQGEDIETIEQVIENSAINVKEGTKLLEKAENYMEKSRRMIRDIAILVSGTGLGALGFLGGPLIGGITLGTGLFLGVGTIATVRSIQS